MLATVPGSEVAPPRPAHYAQPTAFSPCNPRRRPSPGTPADRRSAPEQLSRVRSPRWHATITAPARAAHRSTATPPSPPARRAATTTSCMNVVSASALASSLQHLAK